VSVLIRFSHGALRHCGEHDERCCLHTTCLIGNKAKIAVGILLAQSDGASASFVLDRRTLEGSLKISRSSILMDRLGLYSS